MGYRQREVRILLDPDKLQGLGISYGEIIAAIERRNVRDSGGSLESFVAEKKVLVVGQFDHPKQAEDVIVRATDPGNLVRVRDVAEVVLDYEDWKVQLLAEGNVGIALLPRKKAAADGLERARALREFVREARRNLPPGVRLTVINDISRFTYDMLGVLKGNALLGFALVFVVLLTFFHFRLAFWVAAGLPVAIAITFTIMPLCGLGIDVMTLTALILVLGMLVDDAIVTGESIYRQREAGLDPITASIQGASQVARPVFVGTATTVLAVRIAFDGAVIDELRTVEEKIDYRLQYRSCEQGKMETLRDMVMIQFLLVVLFNSMTQPFLIMAVIPFGIVGVIAAYALQGIEMSMLALIGILGHALGLRDRSRVQGAVASGGDHVGDHGGGSGTGGLRVGGGEPVHDAYRHGDYLGGALRDVRIVAAALSLFSGAGLAPARDTPSGAAFQFTAALNVIGVFSCQISNRTRPDPRRVTARLL